MAGHAPLTGALSASEEDTRLVEKRMRAADRPAPHFWDPGIGTEIWVPVEGAEIRVLHFPSRDSAARRPIVMAPGFGATPDGFQDFYAAVRDLAELYYLETREKSSSRILDRRTDMSVTRSARDMQQAFAFLGLAGRRDFVLVAPCWGAATVLEGLIQGILEAPTVVVADPMHALWFPRWLLRYVAPWIPSAALRVLRPLFARAMLGDMQEPTQKQRATAFVYGADLWKWRKSGAAARNFELFGRLAAIHREVFVLNGTADKIHDQRLYPRMAVEMPLGRFIYMPTGEENRERLFGAAALEFARVSAADGLPPALARFEKAIR